MGEPLSLEELVKEMKSSSASYWLDDDILAELFENTEIAGRFVELVESFPTCQGQLSLGEFSHP